MFENEEILTFLRKSTKKEIYSKTLMQRALTNLNESASGKEIVFMPYGPQGKGYYAKDYRGK